MLKHEYNQEKLNFENFRLNYNFFFSKNDVNLKIINRYAFCFKNLIDFKFENTPFQLTFKLIEHNQIHRIFSSFSSYL